MLLELCGLLIFTFTIYEIIQVFKRYSQGLPGPFGVPVFGHLPFLGSNPLIKLLEWKQEYGSIFSIRFGSYPAVILSDAKVIREAFNRPEFCGRPTMRIFVLRSPSGKREGILAGDGAVVEEQRQFCTKTIKDQRNSIVSSTCEGIVDFVDQLKHTEGQEIDIKHPLNCTLTNTFWSVLMGDDFRAKGLKPDLLLACLENMGRNDTVLSKLGVFIPWLDHILNFVGNLGSNICISSSRKFFAYIQSEIEKSMSTSSRISNQPTSIVDAYLDKIEATKDPRSSFYKEHNVLPYFAGDMYIAATETVRTTLEWLVYYMTKYPEVQLKLQEELDTVVGSSRIPTLEDRPLLPYIEAVTYEILRVCTVAPLAIFHRATEDSILHSYKIPKDTLIIPNMHAVHNDKEIWGDPQNFRPERWLETDSFKNVQGQENQRSKSQLLNHFLPFCAGRRVCLGQDIAINEIFLFTSILFQKYNVYLAKDNPPVKAMFGTVVSPSKFQVVFRKRQNIQ